MRLVLYYAPRGFEISFSYNTHVHRMLSSRGMLLSLHFEACVSSMYASWAFAPARLPSHVRASSLQPRPSLGRAPAKPFVRKPSPK
jgi:hypothetical protein